MELKELATKTRILEGAGYRYSFDREVYFNRQAKKAFSVEFVEDRSEDEIEQLIRDNAPSTNWRFFLSSRLPRRSSESSLTYWVNGRAHRRR